MGIFTKSLKINYQVIAISTGLILLSSTIFGSTPIVFADDDHKNKWKKLKDLIEKWKKKKKCPEKYKYGDICDNKKPKIKITSPKKKQHVEGDTVMITGTASDNLSGIKEILVKVDRNSYVNAEFDRSTNTWKFTTDLRDGWHLVLAKAIDFVGNSKRTFTFFKVV